MQEITDSVGKAAAQQALHDALTLALSPRGDCAIGYRGGGGMHPVWSNGPGQLYYSYSPPYAGQAVQRHWNAFGLFVPSGQQRIVVETNIPIKGSETRAEGFFARDPISGATLLMHSGRMGGGVTGLTRAAFYAWSGEAPLVARRDGSSRVGVIVAEVGGRDMIAQIAEFVRRIAAFKSDLEAGLLDRPKFTRKKIEAQALMEEFVGTKSGRRTAEFTYDTYHGAVVKALAAERRQSLHPGEKVDKTVKIDLFVCKGAKMLEVYEVKSKVDRPSLYEAIGQLVTHSGAAAKAVARILVVPEGSIAPDISEALAREGIAVRRYRLVNKGETKKVEFL